MRIALDYDGTVSLDPAGFAQFVHMMRSRGHEVFICTMRYPHEPMPMHILALFHNIQVIYTSRYAKKPFCERNGIHVDVWIDNQPEFLLRNAEGAGTTPIQVMEKRNG